MTYPDPYGNRISRRREWTAAKSAIAELPSVRCQLADRRLDLFGAHHEPVLERVVVRPSRDVRPGDSRHGPVEIVERLLGHECCDFRPVPPEPTLVIDDPALHRLSNPNQISLVFVQ